MERKKKAKDQLALIGEGLPETLPLKMELVFRLIHKFKDSYS
jgi:hypothetical protein